MPAYNYYTPMSTPASAYDVLEVSSDATIDDIKSAFRKLSLAHHPDKVHGPKEAKDKAQEAFVQVREAYETLMDPAKREALDAELGIRGRSRSGSHYTASRPPESPPRRASRPSRRSRSQNQTGRCDCGLDHIPPLEAQYWVDVVLRPKMLYDISYMLEGMLERVSQLRSWYIFKYPGQSKTIDTLASLINHIGRFHDIALESLLKGIRGLPDSCTALPEREKLLDRTLRAKRRWWRWQAAEETIAKYWNVMWDADPEEAKIMQRSFLKLLQRWRYDL